MRARLDPMEATLLAVTVLHMISLPWALGTVHPWSQLASLGCSLLGFALATVPRIARDDLVFEQLAFAGPATRLCGFPVFWAGLLLLIYIALQGLNPAARFMSDGTSWRLEPLNPISWLPSGIAAPFERSNPWRIMVVGTSLWLLLCSIWMGFLRRRSFLLLFTALAGNAVLLALLGIAQKLSGAKEIFWAYAPSNHAFMATFIYPNHAGPYLYLLVALSIGLAWRMYQYAGRASERPGLARLLTLGGVLIGVAVIFSYSRASILLLMAFSMGMGAILCFRRITLRSTRADHPEFLPLALALAIALAVGLGSLVAGKLWSRFAPLLADPVAAAHSRTVAREAATEMLQSRWLYGWGAGCFRYGFPLFAQAHPDIYEAGGDHRQYWEHAHNDLLEIPIELGVVGLLPVLGGLGWAARRLFRLRFWRNTLALPLVLGCGLVVLHAWVDFVFQNPAVLFTWSVLLVGVIRWLELDSPGAGPAATVRRRRSDQPKKTPLHQ